MLTQCSTCHAYYDPSFVTVHNPPEYSEHTHVIHPSDETLAAFIDGTLTDPECIRVNDHLNYCPRCYKIVSETREVLRAISDDAMREKQTAQDEVREGYQELYRQNADRRQT